jgi:hypothetical protein
MSYPSVDSLQKLLAGKVFHYAKDAKKASGRALGTLVEIITFYTLKAWGFEQCIAIERPLPEFANSGITHNVEYSLHPVFVSEELEFGRKDLPITARKIAGHNTLAQFAIPVGSIKSHSLLTKHLVLRNACTICDLESRFLNAYLKTLDQVQARFTVACLHKSPFAIFECKRVGVEEGMRKGPQTIEKAKQGAYVAKAVSSLQKFRLSDGRIGGLIQNKDGTFRCEEYYALLAEVIASDKPDLLSQFILTVGVVSNHGNWFTSENHNKEMKVLAQSYDWLLFLTDAGIAQFVDQLLLHPSKPLKPAREAFLASYRGQHGVNRFTKVQIALEADLALQGYFRNAANNIQQWFNVVAPAGKRIAVLKEELHELQSKNWEEIHA